MIDWILVFEYMGYWLLFGVSHTLLTLEGFKKVVPLNGRAYRIFYNVVAAGILFFIFTKIPSITSVIVSGISGESETTMKLLFYLLAGLGIIVAGLGVLSWDILGFLGLTKEDGPLKTKGIFGLSRHPVYSGILLLFLSALVLEFNPTTISWFFGAGGYFIVGTIPEEKKLNGFFTEYQDYRLNVGRFFPWKNRHFNYIKNK